MQNRKSQFVLSVSCIGFCALLGAAYEYWTDPTTRGAFVAIVIAFVVLITPLILLILSCRHMGTKLGKIFLGSLVCYAVAFGYCFILTPIMYTNKLSAQESELAAKKVELQMRLLKGHHIR